MTPTLTAPSAGSKATAIASTPEKYPFFPDNVEYWFEAKRAFGAASYGSSEFGEVMASLNRITPATTKAGITSGMPQPNGFPLKLMRNWLPVIA